MSHNFIPILSYGLRNVCEFLFWNICLRIKLITWTYQSSHHRCFFLFLHDCRLSLNRLLITSIRWLLLIGLVSWLYIILLWLVLTCSDHLLRLLLRILRYSDFFWLTYFFHSLLTISTFSRILIEILGILVILLINDLIILFM